MAENSVNYRAIPNSGRAPATGAHKIGPADPKEMMSVSVRVRKNPDAPELQLDRLTSAPPKQRKVLTRGEFAEKHGASQADLDAVVAFAKQEGLKVEEVSAARRTVRLSGTVAQMSHAFSVDLSQYQTGKETYRGHEDDVKLPETLAPIVESAHGFDNRQISQPMFRAAVTSPQGVSPLTPPQVAKLYQFPTNSAAGQTIAILEFGGGYKTTDIQAYFNNTVKLPVPSVIAVGVDGATNSPGQNADTEVILDIDVAGSVAPGAKIAVYFAPNTVQGWIDAITTAIHDNTNKPSVISISWAGSESGWGSSITSVSNALAEAAAVGVTIFVSSGDGGSGNPAEVLYPASDPWVTGCGGTTVENVSGTSFTQAVWGGSGGGISNHFARPYWQTWAGIPSSTNPAGHVGRGVPDIAGNADPSSGYELILNGAPTGPWGGTSAVSPLYAGLVALLNAALGEPVGYFNYNLYAFVGPYVYQDITSGSNGAYSAKAGWDACTGFGSINGAAMSTALEGVGLPPALEFFNTKLYMAWKGMERDDRIFYSSFNGTSWAAQTMVSGVATSSGVALAVFNGKLYMAWKGMNADQGIYYSSFNGTSWATQKNIPGVGSSVGPALAVFNNALYAAWKGIYGDQALYYSSFNGTSWAPQKSIPSVWSSEGPSLAMFNGRLYAAWKGMLADQSLWFSFFNGTSWAPQQNIPGTWSSIGPSLMAFNNKLYATWKGMLGDQRIWYTAYNGATWAAQQVVPGVGTSPDLVVEENEPVGQPATVGAGR